METANEIRESETFTCKICDKTVNKELKIKQDYICIDCKNIYFSDCNVCGSKLSVFKNQCFECIEVENLNLNLLFNE